MKRSFSKTKIIPLRKAFSADGTVVGKEATDFTPWLCKDDNLNYYLGEALGMTLEEPKKEQKVGSFSLDILCKNTKDKSLVAIENQFGTTDHKHLGQLLTYGAGLKASTMVWIAEDFTVEHLATLKWLNKNTNLNKKISFFGVKVEAKKIGDSNTAIDFVVVAHPTDWHKPKYGKKQKISKGALTPMEILKKRYWQGLEKYMADNGSKLTGQTPGPWQSQYFNIGKAGTGIKVKVNTNTNRMRVDINLDSKKTCKAFFNLLYKDKDAIDGEFGRALDWQEFPEKGYSSIGINIKNINFRDDSEWAKQYVHLKKVIEKFDKVFTTRIRNINPKDWDPTAPK